MVIDVVEVVGKSHVVTKHGLEHVVTIIRDRELDTLKNMGFQGEYIPQVIHVVELDSVITHERFSSTQVTDTTKDWK